MHLNDEILCNKSILCLCVTDKRSDKKALSSELIGGSEESDMNFNKDEEDILPNPDRVIEYEDISKEEEGEDDELHNNDLVNLHIYN